MKRNIFLLVLVAAGIMAGITYFKDIRPEVKTTVKTVDFKG